MNTVSNVKNNVGGAVKQVVSHARTTFGSRGSGENESPSAPPTIAGFFAGVGGIELGLKQAGFSPVYSNEIDDKPATTLSLNAHDDEIVDVQSIRDVISNELPDVDMITGGFPCQAFSLAGHRAGFEDERGHLFFDIAGIIEDKNPSMILLENVKNLRTHDKGNTFEVIVNKLERIGYHVKAEVLNAADYGNVPQGRERIYIVGFKDRQAAERFEFPGKIPLTTTVRDLLDLETKLDDKYYYTSEKYGYMFPMLTDEVVDENVVYQWRRKYVRANKSGVCPTLTANMGAGGHNVPLVLTEFGIRKLTPRECFRLMGFPDSFKLPDLANSHLYKQAGNSVVVPVIKRIGENMLTATGGNAA